MHREWEITIQTEVILGKIRDGDGLRVRPRAKVRQRQNCLQWVRTIRNQLIIRCFNQWLLWKKARASPIFRELKDLNHPKEKKFLTTTF
jgi:hypothetical protein